jgi:dihydroorotase
MRQAAMHPTSLATGPEGYWIRGVTLFNPFSASTGVDLRVENGRVAEIQGSDRVTGLCLMPSGVDTQAHLRVPGQTRKETAESSVLAAFFGGFGAVLSMPNTRPVIDDPETLALARSEVAPFEKQWGIQVLFSAAITLRQRGDRLAPLEELARAGARAFTDDGLGVASDALMDEAFERLGALGLALLQHAEMPGHGGVLAPGRTQRILKVRPYPDSAEANMIARDLRLLARTPSARYHVLHVSARSSLDEIRRAKAMGLKVTAEVTPHHLRFNHADIDPGNTAFKMNPPLRSAKDQQALIEALGSGAIDWMATDHAPHEPEAKSLEWERSAFGTTAHEAALRVLLELWSEGHLTSQRLVQVFSSAPAEFLGLPERDGWGAIRAGRPLRAILVDPRHPATPVSKSDLHGQSLNSVFLGCPLPGRLLWQINPAGVFRINPHPIGETEQWIFLRATPNGKIALPASARSP